MNNKIVGFLLFFTWFMIGEVGHIDFDKKFKEWRLGDPNTITYQDFNALIQDAQASDRGLAHLMNVIGLPDLNVNKVFIHIVPNEQQEHLFQARLEQRTTTPLIMAMQAKLTKIVDALLARGASLHLQGAYQIPYQKVISTKEKVIKDVIRKSYASTGKKISEGEFAYLTTALTDQEVEEINRIAPSLLHEKIDEYRPIMDVIERYAQDRRDRDILQAIDTYKQKFDYITKDIKDAYSADSNGRF